mmetsp:Transcript_14194/g.34463  ORF Transcript_14194/g.34463 Transcript_14194/m.34463 type:complete len:81 (-) Transcript_14194:424-666(-)
MNKQNEWKVRLLTTRGRLSEGSNGVHASLVLEYRLESIHLIQQRVCLASFGFQVGRGPKRLAIPKWNPSYSTIVSAVMMR